MKWNWSIFVVLIGNFLIKKWFIFVCLIVEKKFCHNNIFSHIKVYIASHIFILKCISCVYFLFLSKLNKWNKIWAYWELKEKDIKCTSDEIHCVKILMQWNDLYNKNQNIILYHPPIQWFIQCLIIDFPYSNNEN